MTYAEPTSVFPTSLSGVSLALAEEAPVLIDGMKVLFDEKVVLYPVTLEPDPEAEGDR